MAAGADGWAGRGVRACLVWIAAAGLHAGAAAATAAGERPPNVLLIMADDQGAWDMQCYGATDLATPHLDALASRGVRFRQFYVGSSICSPSRACLMTGRYPQRAGLPTNAGKRGMPTEQITIAEMLGKAGYRTGLFGKWHLGEGEGERPNAQGFEEFLGHRGGCIDNYSHYFYWSGPNRHDLWRNDEEHFEPGIFFPEIVVREACRFLEAHREHPFFLYLPFNTPHYPMQAEQHFIEMYAAMQDANRQRYAAFVTSMDDKIGRVLGKLDELGLSRDTLVIFLSDNGHSVEDRAFGGGGSAGPYRGHKFTVWEGGLRLPCIVSWPGRIPRGEVRDQIVHAMDWLPTVADYCGVALPGHPIDGASIRTVIESPDAPSPHEALHWQVGERWAVRSGDWKLVRDGKQPHLSNLAADLAEATNLAEQHPDVVTRLAALHEAWAADTLAGTDKALFELKAGQVLSRPECPRGRGRSIPLQGDAPRSRSMARERSCPGWDCATRLVAPTCTPAGGG
ncbi:MAG: sulfatase-like hydrolase/transferase [Lentisphaeria bacterium]|nr:sulfatase-like hydrolase/transferase [Lentisphaeria bacterium]